MLKVAARNKFSRKTSVPFNPQDPTPNRKPNRNRSSILINGQTYQQYFQFVQCQNIIQSDPITKKTISNLNSSKNHQSGFAKKCKLKKTLSIKPLESDKEDDKRTTSTQNKKFNKLTNEFNGIKIHENEDRKSQKSMIQSKTSTPQKLSMRTSAIKKTGNRFHKADGTILRNSQIKKASVFNMVNQGLGQQSQNYEEFLKQSNLYQLSRTKKNVIENENEIDSNKQNQQQAQSKQILLIKGRRLSKLSGQKLVQSKNKQRGSSKILKSNLSKTRKISQNELQINNDYHPTFNELYQSLTQKNIQKCDQKNIKFIQPLESDSQGQNKQQQQQQTQKKQQLLKKAQQKRIQQQRLYKQQTQQLFRKLQRQIASKQQLLKFQKKSNNYYQELRIKLTKKYDQISRDYKLQEKQKDKIGLLLQGCNLQRHRRVNNFYFEKKQFLGMVRPDTAGAIDQASKDINRLNFVTKQRNKTIMRPQTSRPKSSYNRSKGKNSYEKSSYMISDYITNITGLQTERDFHQSVNKTCNKFSEDSSQYIFCMTNPNLKTQANLKCNTYKGSMVGISKQQNNLALNLIKNKARQAVNKQKQCLTTKFEALLGICDDQNQQHESTKKKMKVFQYYCQKMDNGFEKLSQRIKDYVSKL